ncbi:MAG: tetratricopeptide repeat protein, partial [Ktedonobacteraceae bacterium]
RAERFGYQVLQGVALIYMGALAIRQGRFTQSQDILQRALTLLRKVGNHLWLGQALFELGALAAIEGDAQQALVYFQECLESAQKTSDRETMGLLFEERGKLEMRRGDYQQAEHYLRDALQIGRDLGLNYLICSALFSWGELHIQCQRLNEAEQSLTEMQATVPSDHRELRAMSLYGLARLAAARHDFPEARQQGQTSLAIFSAIGHYRASEVEKWLAGGDVPS